MDHADLIESALTSGEAFVQPPAEQSSFAADTPTAVAPEATSDDVPAPVVESTTAADTELWKSQYEEQLRVWKEQSAEAREKAEKERARWEAIRAEEAAQRKAAGIIDTPTEIPTGIPTNVYGPRPTTTTSSSSPEEASGAAATAAIDHHTEPESLDGSQKWVNVQAAASTASFPSTFPEQTEPSSPAPQAKALNSSSSSSQPPAASASAPSPSATLAIFDPSLSAKTRALALLSALAINLALPFVNGVMLGFGEIFAKNIVLEYFGWRPVGPGHVAANAGLSSTRRSIFKSS